MGPKIPKMPAAAPPAEIAPAPVASATATDINPQTRKKKSLNRTLYYLRTANDAGLGSSALGAN
jgi:hypothetical protein